ncbi:Cell division ATP-binding protein FtsE [bacterium HR40]|nr:Cell division ATP-binding protein FtsE [bacterium HR40]
MEPPDTVVLRLQSVGMRYDRGEEVLCDLDLAIKAGTFFFLTGPSGAGKTSLLRLLSLSHPPSRGIVELFGRDVGQLDREQRGSLRRRIGVVFQDFRLLDHLSAFDNVALPLRIGGLAEEQIAMYVSEMLSWLGLGECMECRPGQLSMGQRQLVTIARAVITRPSLLLADEPLSNLDSRRRKRVMHLFTQMHRQGTTILMATHDHELLRHHPFGAIELDAGRIVRVTEGLARQAAE